MKVRDFCSRTVAVIEPGASLREAALLMRDAHVGALVVTERKAGVTRPVGVITDRDIIVAAVAVPGARPEGIRVGDVMSAQPHVARDDEGLAETVKAMSQSGVRRLPVVSADGALFGIVTLDDVLRVLAGELGALALALSRGREQEAGARRPLQAP
ncbi:MAG TPA: CBS domain-containing protein [Burkholderiales bacterium]|jgi:CBS domain-containing protein|nr:CBS domain-containing protein [Burkholderiales bacterium]